MIVTFSFYHSSYYVYENCVHDASIFSFTFLQKFIFWTHYSANTNLKTGPYFRLIWRYNKLDDRIRQRKE